MIRRLALVAIRVANSLDNRDGVVGWLRCNVLRRHEWWGAHCMRCGRTRPEPLPEDRDDVA